jgi:hypothetical protein
MGSGDKELSKPDKKPEPPPRPGEPPIVAWGANIVQAAIIATLTLGRAGADLPAASARIDALIEAKGEAISTLRVEVNRLKERSARQSNRFCAATANEALDTLSFRVEAKLKASLEAKIKISVSRTMQSSSEEACDYERSCDWRPSWRPVEY